MQWSRESNAFLSSRKQHIRNFLSCNCIHCYKQNIFCGLTILISFLVRMQKIIACQLDGLIIGWLQSFVKSQQQQALLRLEVITRIISQTSFVNWCMCDCFQSFSRIPVRFDSIAQLKAQQSHWQPLSQKVCRQLTRTCRLSDIQRGSQMRQNNIS